MKTAIRWGRALVLPVVVVVLVLVYALGRYDAYIEVGRSCEEHGAVRIEGNVYLCSQD